MNASMEHVIIIGGGPAGLAAAVYNARAGLNPLVFAGSPPGGQLTLTTEVENYPGFEHILGPDLVVKMREHATKFGTRILDQNITKVDFTRSPFTVSTFEKEYVAKSVLIATGAKALWLGLESETRLRGKGISACATCDGFFFRGKTVAVVGGGDTAMEEALTLTKFASKVYVIHRRDSFRASKIMQERVLKHEKIEVIWNAAIEEMVGTLKVEGIKLREISSDSHSGRAQRDPESMDSRLRGNEAQGSVRTLSVDGIFIAIGHKPDTDLFKGKIELDAKGYIMTAQRQWIEKAKAVEIDSSKSQCATHNFHYMTSVEGVLAAGDCVDYLYRQAATAAGMGVAAALETERWLETSIHE